MFSLHAKAAMRQLGASRAWDPAKHPRLPKGGPDGGEFRGAGSGSIMPPAPTDHARAVFTELKRQGLTQKQMIAEADKLGVLNARSELDKWLWEQRKIKGGGKVVKLSDLVRTTTVVVKAPEKSLVEFAKFEEGKYGAAMAHSAVVRRLREIEQTAAVTIEQQHGVFQAERMFQVPLGDGALFYTAGLSATRSKAAQLLLDYSKLPPELSHWTRNIYISDQVNKADAYWAKTHGIPGFISSGTGGDGDIVLYRSASSMPRRITAHEMAHNLAWRVYGDVYAPNSALGQLHDSWKAGLAADPPTQYARTNKVEFFAEAVMARFGFEGSDPLNQQYRIAVASVMGYAKRKMSP